MSSPKDSYSNQFEPTQNCVIIAFNSDKTKFAVVLETGEPMVKEQYVWDTTYYREYVYMFMGCKKLSTALFTKMKVKGWIPEKKPSQLRGNPVCDANPDNKRAYGMDIIHYQDFMKELEKAIAYIMTDENSYTFNHLPVVDRTQVDIDTPGAWLYEYIPRLITFT